MTSPDHTLAARLARLRGGEHEAEAEGDYDGSALDQACGNAYRSGQLITVSAHTAAVAKAVEALENIRELNLTAEDENGHKWANSDLIDQEIVFGLIAIRARKGDAL